MTTTQNIDPANWTEICNACEAEMVTTPNPAGYCDTCMHEAAAR